MQRGEFQKANFPYHWIGATFLQAKLVFAQRRGVLEIRFERNFSYQIDGNYSVNVDGVIQNGEIDISGSLAGDLTANISSTFDKIDQIEVDISNEVSLETIAANLDVVPIKVTNFKFFT